MNNAVPPSVPQWRRFEATVTSAKMYANPLSDAALEATFVSPSGRQRTVDGFWDGGDTWRVRFMPDEIGAWSYTTQCSEPENGGLHGIEGNFECIAPLAETPFDQHGAVGVSDNHRYLMHSDGTPFLWLGDTAWNGPMLSTDDEWTHYLRERARQGFTAVQWMTTQSVSMPDGDREGRLAYTGHEHIEINPTFFQQLDGKLEAINNMGLLSAPVLLWAAQWSGDEVNVVNPGFSLPEDQALLLARYMVARWGAHHVLWILNGDGDYRGPKAERWRRIGRALFSERPHAPVAFHPSGLQWCYNDYSDEHWLDIAGYQSGHGDNEQTLHWLNQGPPAQAWQSEPTRVVINLEPPYENHIAYHSKQPHSPHSVRRALYWSLLVSPTAGVSYGGHGVWGWDDGTRPPTNHESTGIPLPWREALMMPAAEQIAHIRALFDSNEWWKLRSAPELLTVQPGDEDASRFIAATRSETGDVALIYVPEDRAVSVRAAGLAPGLRASWCNPRTGARNAPLPGWTTGPTPVATDVHRFDTPAPGDWVLLLHA